MAEEKKPATRKPRSTAKKAETKVEDVVAEVEALAGKVEEVAKEEAGKAEQASVDALRELHAKLLLEEAAAKTELYKLRLRFANQATNVSDEWEALVVKARQDAEEAAAKVREVETKLAGEVKDIWGSVF